MAHQKQHLSESDPRAKGSRKRRAQPLSLETQLNNSYWERFLFLLFLMQSVQILKFTVAAISREDLGAALRAPFSKCFLVSTVQNSHLLQFPFFCHCRFLRGIYSNRQDLSEYFVF